ncbi:TonB-dependent receptor [Chitinophaga sp. Hz27]|uniref:TonB-dependent receptor n=1 Tax=Chitinophaga sp. Hz27 TaxID=3347169 RepID=UPI0035DA4B89
MKLTTFFLLALVLHVSASTTAQSVTYSTKGTSLQKVLHVIKGQTGLLFFYDKEDLKEAHPVTMDVKNVTPKEAVETALKGQQLSFDIQGNTVFITRAEVVAVKNTVTPPPPAEITGKVTDENGQPVPGVSIMVKGTQKGAITSADGSFHLSADGNAILVVTSIGYEMQEVKVGGRSSVNIHLKSDVAGLKQLVVVGYGTQKKANLTGAVTSVGTKELANRPSTSVTNALQGTMPGVTVTSARSGQPGVDNGSIRIRGIGTLNTADPMIVIDGVIATSGDLNNINPDDIANISVLKDAASAAIYGSRAANGVLLVTTKQGKKGPASITYSGYVGKQKPTGLPEYLPSWQAADLYNKARVNEGLTPRYTDAEIQKFKDGSDPYNYPNTDWLGLFYKGSGVQQNHYIGINGGGEKTVYSLSLGVFDENGLVKETNAKRYTTRLNINSEVRQNLHVTGNIGFTNTIRNEPSNPYTGDFTQLVRLTNRISPTVPYKYANGNYGAVGDGNPMAWLEGGSFNSYTYYDLLGNVGLDWEPIKGLHARPSLGYVLKTNRIKNFIADQQYYNANGDATFYQGPSSVKDMNNGYTAVIPQFLLDYTRSFGKHNLKAMAGYSQEQDKVNYDAAYRKGMLNSLITDVNAAYTDGQVANGYSAELALQSVFGRINYDYDGKYLFEANLRYDGSSRFADGYRWGAYPSFSAGWNLDREKFFQPLKSVVNAFKLRGSWGRLGNQNVITIDATNFPTFPYYPTIPTISTGQNYTFGGTSPTVAPGAAPVNGANPFLQWESTTQSGAGFDATLFNNKVSFTAEYFNRTTDNILKALPVAATYGLNAPVQNAVTVNNKGWEFALGYHDSKGDFTYSANLNASVIKNTVSDLKGTSPIIDGYTATIQGRPYNALYGYEAKGLFQTQDEINKAPYQGPNTKPGDIRYIDKDGNDTITAADKIYLGSYFPKVTFGLTLNAAWKGIDLSLFFQGATSVKTYIDAGKLGEIGSTVGKPTSAMLDSWTPDHTNAALPRLLYSQKQNDPSGMPSSYWVKDGSYLRLKNLQIGYSLPESLLKRAGISKFRIYYSGQNILTFDHLYKWVDPEAYIASSLYYYPQVKVNTIGVNVTF